jgi:hypothetical protein
MNKQSNNKARFQTHRQWFEEIGMVVVSSQGHCYRYPKPSEKISADASKHPTKTEELTIPIQEVSQLN